MVLLTQKLSELFVTQGTHPQCLDTRTIGGKIHLLLARYELGQRKHALCFHFSLDFIL